MITKILYGDITKVEVDAIVNAANSSLLGGGGVDGAIHRAGGPEILDACRAIRNKQGSCKTGEAVITTAGNLPAKKVIHTVGPVFNGGECLAMEKQALANCYINSLNIAEANGMQSVAFPNISTGIYRFPKDLAADIALQTVSNYKSSVVKEVIFVCFDEENYEIYKRKLDMKKSKIHATLFGLAIGDALGVPVEFKDRSYLSRFPVSDMLAYGSHHQPAGTWSDDSSLTFCLAESLATNGYDLKDIAQKFISWRNNAYWSARGQVFDIGMQTNRSIDLLYKIIQNSDYGSLKLLKYEADEYTNGNGSLMRILPLIFYIKGKPMHEQFQVIWEVSALTHGHIRAALSCLVYLKFMEYVLSGKTIQNAYNLMQEDIKQFFKTENIAEREVTLFSRIIENDISEYTMDTINSSGYVVHTLEASFWCLLSTNSYLECVFKAINLGDDTDTTATVVGGIAGYYYGLDEVPEKWINSIARKDDISILCDKLNKVYGC